MAISDNVGDREHDKFIESVSTPGVPALRITNPDGTNIGGAGGTSMTDDAAFTPGASSLTPIGAMFDDTAPDQVDEGDVGIPRMTQLRAVHVNLRDAAGAEVSVGGGTQYDEDTVHVSGDKVTMAGVVQQTADAALASATGDRAVLQVDATGFLKANVKATVGLTDTQLRATAVPVSGPLTDTQLRASAVPVSAASLPLPTGAATEATLDTRSGSLTETAPATDTASSGLNGRLQRIAQRLTSLIALLPAALVSGRLDVNLGAAPATVTVQGTAAHDAAVSGNPVRIGGKANLNEPTAVADGDAVDLWADLFGRLVVLTGHPNPEAPVTANGSAAGLSVIAAPGASLSLYICKGTVHNRAATETVVSLRDGAAGTIRWTADLAVDGGGSLFDFGSRGWKLTANTALVADIGQASVDVNVTEFYVAA